MKLIDFTQVQNIFIVCGKTDMRRQIDGLATTILQEYDMNVYEAALFLFCGEYGIRNRPPVRNIRPLNAGKKSTKCENNRPN